MKKIFFALLNLWVMGSYSQQLNFTNKAFEKYLTETEANTYSGKIAIDANHDGKIEQEEGDKVHELQMTTVFNEIDGIKYFRNLKELTLMSYSDDIDLVNFKVDLSKNKDLQKLTILTKIASLDVSGCNNLSSFYFKAKCGTQINLSNNKSLTDIQIVNFANDKLEVSLPKTLSLGRLDLVYCHLAKIDLSGLDNLEYLDLSNNDLESVDISNLKKLVNFEAYNNQLKAIDFSGNAAVKYISIFGNDLNAIAIDNLKSLSILNCDILLAEKLIEKYKNTPFKDKIGSYFVEEKNFIKSDKKKSLAQQDKKELEDFLVNYFTDIKNKEYPKLEKLYFTKDELIALYSGYYQPAAYGEAKYKQFLKDRISLQSLENFRANNQNLLANWNPKISLGNVDIHSLGDLMRISERNLKQSDYLIEFSFYLENNGVRKQFNGFAELIKLATGWKILRGPTFK